MSETSQVDHARRFGGTSRLYGSPFAQIIAEAHVVVVGIGGVGSWVAEGLARLGIGGLTLIDMDHVAESNINRQLHATDEAIGMAKVEAMHRRIQSFHPGCDVRLIDEFVTPENWTELISAAGPVDVVVDACDQLRAKQTMAAWSLTSRRPLIVVGAAGGKIKPQAVEVADLSAVTHDPLLAKLRYQLRRHHGASKQGQMKVTCVFSRETVVGAQDESCEIGDGSLNCHGYGSAATVTGTFGLVAAGAAIEHLRAKRALD